MRSDMAKVIVERPRHGLRQNYRKGYRRKWQNVAVEDLPLRERRGELTGKTKYFSERLGPLRKYLQSQVGKPWDKVFGDICRYLRQDSVIQSHVRDHVFDFVATEVMMIDGEACFASGWYRGRPISSRYWTRFYVCPNSGVLKAVKHFREPDSVKTIDRYVVSGAYEMRRIGGVWYEVELYPVSNRMRKYRDVLLDLPVEKIDEEKLLATYGRRVFAIDKRRMKKHEIRRLTMTAPNLVR